MNRVNTNTMPNPSKNKNVANLQHKRRKAPDHILKTISTFLFLTGIIISLNIFIFALRPISIGQWPQSETPLIALHISAFLCTLAFLLRMLTTKRVPRILKHPVFLLPIALAALSILLSPFHELPIRSILGSTRIGEGIASWLDIGILSAGIAFMCRIRLYRYLIAFTAFLSFSASMILCVSHVEQQHFIAPYFFADYLAIDAIALSPLFVGLLALKIKQPARGIGLYALMNGLIALTKNRFMFTYSLIAPLFFLALWKIPLTEKIKRTLEIGTLAAIPVASIAAFLLIPKISGMEEGFYDFISFDLFRTIASRAYLMEVALNPLIENPLRFLTGHGWGTYVEHITHHIPLDWLDLTYYHGDQWDGLTTDHFHPHHMVLETLSSIGIFGAALLIFYFISLTLYAKSPLHKTGVLVSAGYLSLASSWFFMPPNLPFLALAAATLTKGKYWKIPERASLTALALTIILGFQLFAAAATFYTAYSLKYPYEPQYLTIENAHNFNENCPLQYNDFNAGGILLSKILLDRTRYTISLINEEAETKKDGQKPDSEKQEDIAQHIRAINHLFCQTDNYIHNHASSARLKVARLMTRGEIMLGFGEYLSPEARTYYSMNWRKNLEDWLDETPTRTDQAIPYLLHNIITENEARSQSIIRKIYARNPDDPVALWFKGLTLLNHPNKTEQGLTLMRQALKNGIKRYMPIDEALLKLLET